MVGTQLDGKYNIIRLLGAGAMGSVYEGEHTATGRRVAIKVISSADLLRNEQAVTRFEREARAAGSIETQHITQVLDAGVDRQSGHPFLVMEYLSGEDLQHVLKRVGPVAPELGLRVVAQACLGLQKAHERGVVHRDIKPANLFLAKRDAGELIVKLLDFGIAKVKMDQAQDTEGAGLTQTGSLLGSPLYMSPEQARGDSKAIDHRADLWSLGVVLYELLAGQTPYHHVRALGQLILAICSEWPRHIQEVAPWVPMEVASIVHRALRHNPNERYQSAAEMFGAIRALLPQGWSISEEMIMPLQDTARGQIAAKLALTASLAGAKTNPAATTHPGGATASALVQSQATAPAPSSSWKLALGFAGAAVVITAGSAAFLLSRQQKERPPDPPPIAVTAAQAPTAATATQAPTVAPDPGIKRVNLVIIPEDAAVEIDDEKAPIKNGIVSLTGTLGSVRRVHVHKGSLDTEQDVTISENGAQPPKIALTAAGPKPAGPPVPTAGTTVKQPVQGPPSKPSTPIDDKWPE
ncbi:MAG: serine/threonine-protein kinase [Byssovorax sp.]